MVTKYKPAPDVTTITFTKGEADARKKMYKRHYKKVLIVRVKTADWMKKIHKAYGTYYYRVEAWK